ncbi:MAG TPA: hypothetical protein VG056_04230 [Pirellulales bacterium]|jgi:hypothetical protein|nr:hypothetical protein [Pirellulales bacterium]
MRKLLLLTIVTLTAAAGSGCCSCLTGGCSCLQHCGTCFHSFCRFEDWKLQSLCGTRTPAPFVPAPVAAPVYSAPYVVPPAAAPCATPAPIITQPLSAGATCQPCAPAPVMTQPLSVPAPVQQCAPAPICAPIQCDPCPCTCQPVNPCDPCATTDGAPMLNGMPVLTTPGPVMPGSSAPTIAPSTGVPSL